MEILSELMMLSPVEMIIVMVFSTPMILDLVNNIFSFKKCLDLYELFKLYNLWFLFYSTMN